MLSSPLPVRGWTEIQNVLKLIVTIQGQYCVVLVQGHGHDIVVYCFFLLFQASHPKHQTDGISGKVVTRLVC